MAHLFAVLKLALVVGIAAIVLRSPVAAAPGADSVAVLAPQPPTPPNIILILADDLDLDLETVTTMPHLQALLAGQGMTFSNFFVTRRSAAPRARRCCAGNTSITTPSTRMDRRVADLRLFVTWV